jgi:NAD(P)-dependent dehydrogenase (short-subunit alcohol dehydrogenase family)
MRPNLGYDTKRVVVSGCASGIGLATAELLLAPGAEVHGLDRKAPGLPLASFTAIDLAVPESISAAAAQIGGQVDALFNCAGVPPTHAPLDVLKVNFLGTRYLTVCMLEHMQAGAAIVSTASNGGAGWRSHLHELRALLAEPSFAAAAAWLEQHLSGIANAYSFSKEALILWTMQESANLIKRGIRINCTSPGAVQTPMLDEIATIVPSAAIDAVTQPIGRRSVPLEQAWPLVMLNSAAAAYINGADLAVDGGFAAGAPFKV